MRNRRKRKIVEYFLYKTNPFRPLYMHGVGFRTPPSRLEHSLSRDGYYIWLFRTRDLARSMCAANNRTDSPCSYAEYSQYHLLSSGRNPFTFEPRPKAAARKPKCGLESLA